DEDDLGPAGQDGVEVHLLQLDTVVEDPPPPHHREVTELGGGAGPAMGLDKAHDDVGAALRPPPALAEHGERLADAGGGAEVDAQAASCHAWLIVPLSRPTGS